MTVNLTTRHAVLAAEQHTDWYLAYSKPRSEEQGLEQLLRQGFEAWCPSIKKVAGQRRGKSASGLFAQEILFPRYIFFRPAHAQQSISTARSTLGIASVVRFGVEFARLSHAKLMQIALWVEQQRTQGAAELMGLKPGMAVKVTQGPLAGLDALITMTAQDRVVVLLQLLGKDHEISLPYSGIGEALPTPSSFTTVSTGAASQA